MYNYNSWGSKTRGAVGRISFLLVFRQNQMQKSTIPSNRTIEKKATKLMGRNNIPRIAKKKVCGVFASVEKL